jgi:hypothetical protein
MGVVLKRFKDKKYKITFAEECHLLFTGIITILIVVFRLDRVDFPLSSRVKIESPPALAFGFFISLRY